MLKVIQQTFVKSLQSNATQLTKNIFIYRESILGAKQKALKATYPVCFKLVGEGFFIFMANEYIYKYPSLSPDLNEYGENFFSFIKSFPPARTLPYLPDVAKLEWAWDKIDRMSSFFSSPYPIHRIWETNQDDYEDDGKIMLEENRLYHFRVWKDQHVRKIDVINTP